MSQKCGKSIDFLILFSSDTNCGSAPDTFSRDKICTYVHKGVYVTAGNCLSDFQNVLNDFSGNVQEMLKISQGTAIWNITKMKHHSFDP